ncbi:hypothetical protein [Streptomyces sp. NPDC091268]|uniref:hypothetical protein n=1 Tax=Streptomyces sp. NPDC091268 TaxID=3365979 RepID=UPI00381BD728
MSTPAAQRLRGKVVVVTGAARRQGRVVVEIERVGRPEVGVDGSRATPYEERPGRRDH